MGQSEEEIQGSLLTNATIAQPRIKIRKVYALYYNLQKQKNKKYVKLCIIQYIQQDTWCLNYRFYLK